MVMTLVPDPVEQGLVASLARPGGNVTGLTSHAPGISQKYVERLREAIPPASRFAVIARGFSPLPEIRRETENAARQIGMTLSYVEINDLHHIDSALGKVKRDEVSAVIAPLGGAHVHASSPGGAGRADAPATRNILGARFRGSGRAHVVRDELR